MAKTIGHNYGWTWLKRFKQTWNYTMCFIRNTIIQTLFYIHLLGLHIRRHMHIGWTLWHWELSSHQGTTHYCIRLTYIIRIILRTCRWDPTQCRSRIAEKSLLLIFEQSLNPNFLTPSLPCTTNPIVVVPICINSS